MQAVKTSAHSPLIGDQGRDQCWLPEAMTPAVGLSPSQRQVEASWKTWRCGRELHDTTWMTKFKVTGGSNFFPKSQPPHPESNFNVQPWTTVSILNLILLSAFYVNFPSVRVRLNSGGGGGGGYSAWKLMGVCRWPLKIGPKKIEEKIEFGAKKIDFCKNW